MSSVLYYSNLCKNSQQLIQMMKSQNLGSSTHFINIDNRINKNGQTYIVLQNREEVLLPSVINKVPALLLLNQNYKVVFGNEILNHLKPAQKTYKEVTSTKNEEPMAFSLNGLNDIVSDTYSFLDQSADDLSAKGAGGMRQIHQYSTLNSNTSIVTPEETYQSNTLGNQNFDLDKFQREREQDIK